MTNIELEELRTYIKQELMDCHGYAFIDRTIDLLFKAISKQKTFSVSKFIDWFRVKNIAYKNNPLGFLEKCAIEDITNGKFAECDDITPMKNRIIISTLISALKKNKIKIVGYDCLYIEAVEQFILDSHLMTIRELVAWNHKAVEYLANKGKTTQDFIFLFENTRDMRALNISFRGIKENFRKEVQEWEEMLNELSANDWFSKDETPFVEEESETKNGKETRRFN